MNIVYANEVQIEGFWRALDSVAKERIYIELTEAPELAKTIEFQKKMIDNDWPAYYACDGDKVVGWADISPFTNPRLKHRGVLGMGLISSYRGRGLGTLLLNAALDHAKRIGVEKVELTVYTENANAIKLYRSLGFEDEGVIRKYRKLDSRYFDCLAMGKLI
jgi:RimJ/RimL family protein N-acetyltransferase